MVLPHQIHKKFKKDRGAFNCYEINKSSFHPIILATENAATHTGYLPFHKWKRKISRLIMNLVFLQNGYLITNIRVT
jgi:hypothetical protein